MRGELIEIEGCIKDIDYYAGKGYDPPAYQYPADGTKPRGARVARIIWCGKCIVGCIRIVCHVNTPLPHYYPENEPDSALLQFSLNVNV